MPKNAREIVDAIDVIESYGFKLKAIDEHGLIEFERD